MSLAHIKSPALILIFVIRGRADLSAYAYPLVLGISYHG